MDKTGKNTNPEWSNSTGIGWNISWLRDVLKQKYCHSEDLKKGEN